MVGDGEVGAGDAVDMEVGGANQVQDLFRPWVGNFTCCVKFKNVRQRRSENCAFTIRGVNTDVKVPKE